MGYAIAQAAAKEGAEVNLISGPVALDALPFVKTHYVRSAKQMHSMVFQLVAKNDIFIATAAVADYRPALKINQKIKKDAQTLTLELVKNPDILSEVAALSDKPLCIGFAAETNALESYAIDKLTRKNLDMIVANKVGDSINDVKMGITFKEDNKSVQAIGFESDNNELQLFFWAEKSHVGDEHKLISKKLLFASKKKLAQQLIEEIAGLS
jgi:phosphopantothenoylcysteine decarboxylase/phosphopantothenate--cysteine ligase